MALEKFINVNLMTNPFNWLTVTLMVIIGGLAIALIFDNGGSAANGD